MSTVCRICLSQEQHSYVSIFDAYKEVVIVKAVTLCTGIKIKRRDYLPKEVCEPCADEIVKFYALRQRCIESDTILRQVNDSSSREATNSEILLSSIKEIDLLDTDGATEAITDSDNKPTIVDSTLIEVKVEDYGCGGDALYVIQEVTDIPGNISTSPDITAELIKKPRRKRIVSKQKSNTSSAKPATPDDSFIKMQYVCCGCPSLQFDNQKSLDLHRNDQHEKYRIASNLIRPFECDQCYNRFLTERQLEHHKLRPYRKRKFICTSCGLAYLASCALRRHEEICNTSERNYSCEECGKRFLQIATLQNHRKLHGAEKKFSCPICAKTFVKKFEVSLHMITHTEEQPFPCDQCPARFKRKQALHNHQRHHANPRPYKCDLCDEWFNSFNSRKLHRQKVHEGFDPFKCDHCGASFGRRIRLTQHIEKVHSNSNSIANVE